MGLDCVYMVLNRIIPRGLDKTSLAPGTKEDSSHAPGKRTERPRPLYLIAQVVQNLTTCKLLQQALPEPASAFCSLPSKKMNDGKGFSIPGKQSK